MEELQYQLQSRTVPSISIRSKLPAFILNGQAPQTVTI